MNPTKATMTTLLMMAGGLTAAEPPKPPPLPEVEEVLQELQDRARQSAAKLKPGNRDLMRQWGRCEAAVTVVCERKAAAETRARRVDERVKAIEGIGGLDADTRAAVTAARADARGEVDQLTAAHKDLTAELERAKSAFLNGVIRGWVAPPNADTANVLDRVKQVLDPPAAKK